MFGNNVRPSGYYLAKDREEDGTDVVRIITDKSGTEVLLAGVEVGYAVEDFYWISDEPLDLESIRLLMMNGGLENAVKVVHKDSSKTSSVLFLEKDLKRYKDWYGDMDSLSR